MTPRQESNRVHKATISSTAGLQVTVLDIGATIQSVIVPTPHGSVNCVLGYEDRQDYLNNPFYVGSTVGRYANRIRGGRFQIGDKNYQLDVNETSTGNCLHGGTEGLHRQRFILDQESQSDTINCHLVSPAGAEGFPAEVSIEVKIRIVGDFALSLEFIATADSETVLNLANHAYFNLDGTPGSVDAHKLRVVADRYTPVDQVKIPIGEIASVDDTPFDLREVTTLESRVFDHNFVPAGASGELRPVAELYSPRSEIGLLVHSTQPGLHVYTGDALSTPFVSRQGIALEAQNFPDAPNQPGFPSACLNPGETYRQMTIYEFIPPDRLPADES